MYRHWACDPAVTRYLRWAPHRSAEETRQLLEAWALLYPNPDYYQWAIVEGASGLLIGTIGLFDERLSHPGAALPWQEAGLNTQEGIWAVGYCLGQRWWGQGYATEALQAVADFFFRQVDGQYLTASHAEGNPASGAVMQKIGFRFHHCTVIPTFAGEPVPCRSYLLTRPSGAAEQSAKESEKHFE